jgi:ATP phosphoribosyltransferase regulatory subunit
MEEAARRRRTEARFVDVLERAGFAEVVLPIIDYFDPYAGLQGRDAFRQSYRFVDREGELVAIRSDFTPMLARALAPSISDLPLRVYYRGDVIRCDGSRLGANREMFQIGAEIVGDGSVDADVAILRLAADVVRQFGLKPNIVYTDASIIAAVPALRPVLASKRMTDDVPRDLQALGEKFIAADATLDDISLIAPEAAARLRSIQSAAPEFELHLDDFEESAGYYTGLRFRVYDAASRVKLAQGGRYDRLYACFGTPAPAIGFTFTIDDLD